MTPEERLAELERRVTALESRRLPAGWEYYPPRVVPGAPVSRDEVMAAEGFVPRETR